MTSWGSRRALATAVALGVVLVGSTACRGTSADGPSTSESPEPGSSSSSTSSPSESALPEPTPSAEPADGVLIDVPGATMRGLKGYRHVADYGLVQGWGDDQGFVVLSPNLTTARSLDAWAREHAREAIGRRFAERREDAVVAGKYSAWVLADTEDPLLDKRVYGVMYLDGAWTITFGFHETGRPRPLTQEERQEVIDRILATFAPHRETL